jgi:hypothetical protein
VTKIIIDYGASEGTLSRWCRLHWQSYVTTPISRRVDVRQAAGRKNAESLSHDKNKLYRPHLVGQEQEKEDVSSCLLGL